MCIQNKERYWEFEKNTQCPKHILTPLVYTEKLKLWVCPYCISHAYGIHLDKMMCLGTVNQDKTEYKKLKKKWFKRKNLKKIKKLMEENRNE